MLIWRSRFDFVFRACICNFTEIILICLHVCSCEYMSACVHCFGYIMSSLLGLLAKIKCRIYNVESYACRNSFNSFFPVWMPFVSLSGLISLRRGSGMMWNKSGNLLILFLRRKPVCLGISAVNLSYIRVTGVQLCWPALVLWALLGSEPWLS